MVKLLSKILIIAGILTLIWVGYLWFSGSKNVPQTVLTKNILTIKTPAPSPTPVPTVITASDGKMSLTLKTTKLDEKTKYSVILTDIKSGKTTELYYENLDSASSITIPENTFAPDDKYIFIKKNSATQKEYIVLSTSGKNFKNEQKTVEISSLFNDKYEDYKITDITGWAAPDLIIVNTDTTEGKTGPSFWFDTNSFSFTRLTNRFN